MVSTILEQLRELLAKLHACYDGKLRVNVILCVVNLMSTKYPLLLDNNSNHMEKLSKLVEHIRTMNPPLADIYAVLILIASIGLKALMPLNESLETVSENISGCEGVASAHVEAQMAF